MTLIENSFNLRYIISLLLTNKMVNKLDQNTLQNIETIFGNKKVLEILNTINQGILANELLVKSKKSIDVNLKGWSADSQAISEGNEINELKETGLVIEGSNTGIDGKTIRKFALTNEGISILGLANKLGLINNKVVTTVSPQQPKPVQKIPAPIPPKPKPVAVVAKPKAKGKSHKK